jgi:hypothetical protein
MTLKCEITQPLTFSCSQSPGHVLLFALCLSINTSHYLARSSQVSEKGLGRMRSGPDSCNNTVFSWWCLGNFANYQNQGSWLVGGGPKIHPVIYKLRDLTLHLSAQSHLWKSAQSLLHQTAQSHLSQSAQFSIYQSAQSHLSESANFPLYQSAHSHLCQSAQSHSRRF